MAKQLRGSFKVWPPTASSSFSQADQALLRPRIQALGGAAGVARLDQRLAEIRAEALGPGTPPRLQPRPVAAPGTPPQDSLGSSGSGQTSPTGSDAAGVAQRSGLVWELLHDPGFKLPDVDRTVWSDAMGVTSVMKVGKGKNRRGLGRVDHVHCKACRRLNLWTKAWNRSSCGDHGKAFPPCRRRRWTLRT